MEKLQFFQVHKKFIDLKINKFYLFPVVTTTTVVVIQYYTVTV